MFKYRNMMTFHSEHLLVGILLMAAYTNIVDAQNTGGRSCTVSGKTVFDGATFTLTLAGPCVTFTCRNGQVFPEYSCSFHGKCLKVNETLTEKCFTYKCNLNTQQGSSTYSTDLVDWGCSMNGQCHPSGHEIEQNCRTLRCNRTGQVIGFRTVSQGCSFNGKCLEVNETLTEKCFTYKCNLKTQQGRLTYSIDLDDWGCSRNGQCYPSGHEIEQNCHTLRCNRTGQRFGFRTVSQGCQVDKKCVKVGETLEDACRTIKCTLENVNGIGFFSLNPIKTRCQDSNLDCHDPGTYFPYGMQGAIQPNCTCVVTGSNIMYFC